MAEDILLSLLPLLCIKRGSRGTEAVKLSAKLLSGLTLIALIAVAVIGLSNSASAAVDGKVYVTNRASTLTTEAGNPTAVTTGDTARKTATTVYGTYASALVTGATARDTVTNADQIIVTVVDSDINVSTDVTSNDPAACTAASLVGTVGDLTGAKGCGNAHNGADGTGYDLGDPWTSADILQKTGSGFDTTDDTVQVILTESVASPIVGSVTDVKVYIKGNGLLETAGVRVVSIDSNGDGTNPPKITLAIDYGTGAGTSAANNAGSNTHYEIRYPTSAFDVITASVKSVVDTTGSVVTLTETARNSGRFEGYVTVMERTATVTQGRGANYCPTIVIDRLDALSDSAASKFNIGGKFEPTLCMGDARTLGAKATPATIPATAGPITIKYVDVVTSGTATNASVTATYSVDVTPPTLTFTSPVTGAASQSRLPSFTGAFTDNESGVDVSSFELRVDDSNDALNAVLVFTPGNADTSGEAVAGQVASDLLSVTLTGVTDGTKTFTFSKTATATLPTGVNTPDHLVDFQARASDMAGNYGYTDADTASDLAGLVVGGGTGGGRLGNQVHTTRIDTVLPSISSAESGSGFDETIACCTAKANVRDMIKVTFDGKLKADSVAATDFQVILDGTGGTFVPATVSVKDAVVYLDIDSTIPSNDTPKVKLVGVVQDLAGNSSSSGEKDASDKLAPVITVVYSAGSGTGTADNKEDAATYTKDKMTITVTSDENLQGPPLVTVTDISATGVSGVDSGKPGAAALRYNGVLAVAQGGNVWKLIAAKLSSAVINADTAVFRAVKVVSTDVAGQVTTTNAPTTASPAVHTKAYTLDLALTAPTSTPAGGGTTTQSNPFLTTDYKAGLENSSVTITEATIAAGTATAVTVTDSVIASADSKTFFYQPAEALADGAHTYVVKGVDAAGNKLTTTTTFTKSARKDFVIELFAGWNSVSVPSNPTDTGVDAVLSNTGVKQVVSYDATTPAQPWRIASKVDGTFTSQTDPGLTTVTAGPGYWVETSDFEDQTISLEGPTAPGDARPGLTTIATGDGWNLVGVVDQSRSQTQKGNKGGTLKRPDSVGTATAVTVGTYFNTVNNGRAYIFNTVASEFRELVTANTMTIGSGVWVFISPQTNGGLPHIVP
jgi:hypothetical protein